MKSTFTAELRPVSHGGHYVALKRNAKLGAA